MRGGTFMGSPGFAAAKSRNGANLPPLTIVELASIICTGPMEVFWASSAAERRTVQWKGLPVQRKAPHVQRKATPGAAESCSSQLFFTIGTPTESIAPDARTDWCAPGDTSPGRPRPPFCRSLVGRPRGGVTRYLPARLSRCSA